MCVMHTLSVINQLEDPNASYPLAICTFHCCILRVWMQDYINQSYGNSVNTNIWKSWQLFVFTSWIHWGLW